MRYQTILLFFLLNVIGQSIFAQTEVQVKKIDFRGQRAQKAFVAAHAASKKDVIVVMLRGADISLINQVEQNMKGLIQSGYDRLGLIICDLLPDDKSATIEIMSQGLTYAVLEDAKVSAKLNLHLYQLVRDAYKEDIISKLD